MPLYEFRCNSCRKDFEELIRNETDFQRLECPHCSSRDLRRLLSPFGLNPSPGTVTSFSSGGSACNTCATRSCDTCG